MCCVEFYDLVFTVTVVWPQVYINKCNVHLIITIF